MITTKPQQDDEQWQDARLGGMTCRARAWTASTTVHERTEGKPPHPPTRGVQTWRGRAVVEDPHFWATWRQHNRMLYEGPVNVDDEVRNVSAEVFVYTARRVAPRSSKHRFDPNVVVVQFIGAGRLPPEA